MGAMPTTAAIAHRPVEVSLHSGGSLRGTVLEMSTRRARVRVGSDAPDLPLGVSVGLSMGRRQVSATPYARLDEARSRVYGFELGGLRLIQTNRRAAYRVRPALSDEIRAFLGHRLEGRELVDLSVDGFSIMADERMLSRLRRTPNVSVALNLPNRQRPLRLAARARSRRGRTNPIIGFRFEAELTPGFERQQQAIARYVLDRQRELLIQPDEWWAA